MKLEHPIAVMDAECSLCSFGARMVHRLDRTGRIRIAPVQSPLGETLLGTHGIDATDPESWLLIDETGAYRDLEALIHLGKTTGGIGHMLRLLAVFPRPVRYWAYRNVARNRYRLFGRSSFCDLPDPAFRKRLIE